MSRETNQKRIIEQELLKNGRVTNWEIISKFHITRLSEYIRQLRQEYNIKSVWCTNEQTGSRYVEYVLVKE